MAKRVMTYRPLRGRSQTNDSVPITNSTTVGDNAKGSELTAARLAAKV